jgi:hypothetical protein
MSEKSWVMHLSLESSHCVFFSSVVEQGFPWSAWSGLTAARKTPCLKEAGQPLPGFFF